MKCRHRFRDNCIVAVYTTSVQLKPNRASKSRVSVHFSHAAPSARSSSNSTKKPERCKSEKMNTISNYHCWFAGYWLTATENYRVAHHHLLHQYLRYPVRLSSEISEIDVFSRDVMLPTAPSWFNAVLFSATLCMNEARGDIGNQSWRDEFAKPPC